MLPSSLVKYLHAVEVKREGQHPHIADMCTYMSTHHASMFAIEKKQKMTWDIYPNPDPEQHTDWTFQCSMLLIWVCPGKPSITPIHQSS
jgi:hypothetical protein